MTRPVKTKEEGFGLVKTALRKLGASEEVKGKVIAVFSVSASVWWTVDTDYLEHLVRQLVTLFSYKFEDERMAIPANMVYLMSADKGIPSILLHWRVYLSLYRPYVRGWRLETIKDNEGRPIGMIAVIVDKDGNEWRWERYYEGLQLVQRWRNRELMFSKTILKEALAIMFPHLNLLPPLSTVETYDPDDLDTQAQIRPMPQTGPTSVAQPVTQSSPLVQMSSMDIVRGLVTTPPPADKRDRSQDGDLSREVKERFKDLSELVGANEALRMTNEIVRELGAKRFNDLDASKKRFVIMNLDSLIFAERQIRKDREKENEYGE